MFKIGRICTKIAGRDSGKKCVILKIKEDKILIDGQTRRKLVNPKHLEPSKKIIEIKEEATSEVVKAAFDKLGIKIIKGESRAKTETPKKSRVIKKDAKPSKPKKEKKTPVKKTTKKATKKPAKKEVKKTEKVAKK